MQRILVDQANITHLQLEQVPSPALQSGQARLSVKRFALTANNVTYAASGHAIGYWHFFPTGIEGQGIVPVWGFADVTESLSEALPLGARLYGFWPFADEVVIAPQQAGEKGIIDAAPHREKLPPVYNRYQIVTERSADHEGLQALLQPLLATSYLLCDWLSDNSFFKADQIIVGSASSKTGLGLCKFLAELGTRPKIVGLTSAGNAEFVKNLKACDAVLTYDTLEELPQDRAVYVDMSGHAGVKARLHDHLGDALAHSCAVGISHWDQFNPKQDYSGPKPEFFFAPAQIEKRRADWGPGVIERKIGEAWQRLAADAGTWLDLVAHDGLAAAMPVYEALAEGRAAPRDGHVIAL